jgi:hypothetical protein
MIMKLWILQRVEQAVYSFPSARGLAVSLYHH